MSFLAAAILEPLIPAIALYHPFVKIALLFPLVLMPALAGANSAIAFNLIKWTYQASCIAVPVAAVFTNLSAQTVATEIASFDVQLATMMFALHTNTRKWSLGRLSAWDTILDTLKTLLFGAIEWDTVTQGPGDRRALLWKVLILVGWLCFAF